MDAKLDCEVLQQMEYKIGYGGGTGQSYRIVAPLTGSGPVKVHTWLLCWPPQWIFFLSVAVVTKAIFDAHEKSECKFW